MKITLTEISKALSKELLIPKSFLYAVLKAAFHYMEKKISNGDKVVISGFGNFELVDRAPRIGRNPHTGEAVPIPSKKTVKFSPSETWLRRGFRK